MDAGDNIATSAGIMARGRLPNPDSEPQSPMLMFALDME
jgi:hypothetical protein